MRGDGFDPCDPALAARRSVFEMLERVWSAFVPHERLRAAPHAELGSRALDPRSFALLSADERAATHGRFVPYRSDLKLDWIAAQRIGDSGALTDVLLPALFVFPGFGVRHPAQRFVPMLSTGLAAASRYDDALLGGICEVVERDAFAVAWLLRLPPPRIELSSRMMPPAATETVEKLRADGFTVDFFDLTRDIELPVALAAIQSRESDDDGAVALGLGCHPRPVEALSKALREVMLFLTHFYDFPGGTGLARKATAPRGPNGRMEALSFFLNCGDVSARRWEEGPEDDPLSGQMPLLLLRAIDSVTKAGHDILMCDLTPTVADEDRGFVLLRALIPGLQPHLYEPDCWRLASPRLTAVAEQLGWKPEKLTPAKVQREPNPFAWHLT
jgi:ribosomal protein S12 methylthiotransferase accessory factor